MLRESLLTLATRPAVQRWATAIGGHALQGAPVIGDGAAFVVATDLGRGDTGGLVALARDPLPDRDELLLLVGRLREASEERQVDRRCQHELAARILRDCSARARAQDR